MAFENYDLMVPGEHNRVEEPPVEDPVTWPGAYVTRDQRDHDIPARVKEYHEYWEPTVGVQWYQLPRR